MTEPIAPPPIDTTKMARDMSEAERATLLAEFRKPTALPPIDVSKIARDMTEQEKTAWLANLRRQYQ